MWSKIEIQDGGRFRLEYLLPVVISVMYYICQGGLLLWLGGGSGHMVYLVCAIQQHVKFGASLIVLGLVIAFRIFSNMAVVRHIVCTFSEFLTTGEVG